MSPFDDALQQERMRLTGLISEATEKIAQLQDQIAADEKRIEALDAYDHVKTGKVAGGKVTKKSPRRLKSISPAASPEEPEKDEAMR